MIIIHAYIKADPNQRQTFLEQIQQLITHSKAEQGNISYHLYEDATQSNSFVMVEEWQDRDAVKAHEETVHFQAFLRVADALLTEPLRAEIYEAKKL